MRLLCRRPKVTYTIHIGPRTILIGPRTINIGPCTIHIGLSTIHIGPRLLQTDGTHTTVLCPIWTGLLQFEDTYTQQYPQRWARRAVDRR